jgi:uroporphyrinogen decarboxylase
MANSSFQNALHGRSQKIPPIWFMRQAGRYHRHYQQLREKHSFMDLCKIPELAAETAWGPVQDFDFDVAILFSDLLFPLEALGLGLHYDDGGPKLERHLNPEVMKTLRRHEDALPHLEFQKKALQLTREKIPKSKSLIGFVGGPWTLFSYACQGTHSGGLQETKSKLFLFAEFMKHLIPLLIENIRLQLEGGAEVVMVFDTAAGELSAAHFQTQVAPFMNQLANAHPGHLGYYSKGTVPAHLSFLSQAPWAGVGYDHRWDLPQELKTRRFKGFVQGNFDQYLLFLEESAFKREVDFYLERLENLSPDLRAGWVSGLGHGVLPKTPEAHIKYLVNRIREKLG